MKIQSQEYRNYLIKLLNDNKDRIIKMYIEDKISVLEISKQIGVKKHRLWSFLKQNNIEIRPYIFNKYNINENYFEKIDSEEKAYWLGWLFSDGFIMKDYTIGIAINYKDKEILEKFKKCLNSDVPIEEIENNTDSLINRGLKSNSSNKICRFRFKNKKMYNDLLKYGMKLNKSLTLEWPKISEKYFYVFLRGYIDGDGCIYISKDNKKFILAIISAKNFIKSMINFLDKNDGVGFYVRLASRCQNTYHASASNKNYIIKLLDKIYYNCNELKLERKYNKYILMKKELENNPVKINRITNISHKSCI